ncbi:MAG TPA: hypothetical protein VKB08_13935 [Bradyrhizobium sp.]|nr:hypothetical protein [Bradyrhizobium sp.]
MNSAWATSLDQLWRSPSFPMWLTLVVAVFFGIVAIITLVRAERSVLISAVTVIALLAVGIGAAATVRGFAPAGQSAFETSASSQPIYAAVPALSCIDDLAGDMVLGACEKALFGSPENVAAAVSYAAAQITRLTSFGDVATANRSMTLELHTLRRAVERDRYGLMAQVLLARDHCSPSDCAAFRALTDNRQIAANMDQRVYDGLIARYAPSWTAPPGAAAPVAMLSSSMPTGKPTNADFPTAASTPAVSIMSPEPGAGAASAARAPASSPPAANAPLPSPRPPAAQTTAKKPPAPKHTAAAPVQLAPPPGASAPEASSD